MITLRRFKEDDWYALSGCVAFNDGGAPLIGEFTVLEPYVPASVPQGQKNQLDLVVVVDQDSLFFWPDDVLEGTADEMGDISIRNGFSALNFLAQLDNVMSAEAFRRVLTQSGFTPWF